MWDYDEKFECGNRISMNNKTIVITTKNGVEIIPIKDIRHMRRVNETTIGLSLNLIDYEHEIVSQHPGDLLEAILEHIADV